ncbi:MAG: ATP-binding protein [Oscillospiraceae bacterium]|nr:ATP-binding protein [Oscillospiraceae bacterium]
MATDGRILAKAKDTLEEKRRRNSERFEYRLQQAYARVPRIRAIDAEIRETMTDLVAVALGAAHVQHVEDIRLKNLDLQEQRRSELVRAGFPGDYLDDEYMCQYCNDTGFIKTEMCVCLIELYKKEQRESLSSLFKLGCETFDSFKLSYYGDAPAPDTGISPRRSMEKIFEICVEYARNFGEKSTNLFFVGPTGLGKTFLSACIARVVADSGHSVVYDVASSIFSKFEDAKFLRTSNPEEARADVRRCLECDFLILDDLGTEMTTSFTVSALFELINTRLVTGKKMIVNSNLTTDELRRRYSEQIMSRLEGEYQVLTFRGDDIRKKRNI